MKENEIIAALHDIVAANQKYTTWTISTSRLVMLVDHVIKAERERAASKIEQMGIEGYGTLAIAAAIRKGDQE